MRQDSFEYKILRAITRNGGTQDMERLSDLIAGRYRANYPMTQRIKPMIAQGLVKRVGDSELSITDAGTQAYYSTISTTVTKKSVHQPIMTGNYDPSTDLTNPPARLGALDAYALPSRIGDSLVYLDPKMRIRSMAGNKVEYK